jgi:hypothetical protein
MSTDFKVSWTKKVRRMKCAENQVLENGRRLPKEITETTSVLSNYIIQWDI